MAKKNQYISRFSHVGKTKPEKRYYLDLINAPQEKINDTLSPESDNLEPSFTDSYQGKILNTQKIKKINPEEKKRKKRPYKSTWTKIKKYLFNVVVSVIILGVLSLCVNTVWQQHRELGTITANIESINEDINELQDKYNISEGGGLDNVKLLVQFQSDLGYLKERLRKVESKIGL